MHVRATQHSRVAIAHCERSDISTSSTDPGFAFECIGVFDTVLVLGVPFLTLLTLHIQ